MKIRFGFSKQGFLDVAQSVFWWMTSLIYFVLFFWGYSDFLTWFSGQYVPGYGSALIPMIPMFVLVFGVVFGILIMFKAIPEEKENVKP